MAAFGLTFGVGLALALILTPLLDWLGRRWGLVAVPGGRRQHPRTVPRIGGVALYLAFVGAVLVSQLLVVDPWDSAQSLPVGLRVMRFDPKEIFRLIGLLGGGTFIFLAGLYDDWGELSPVPQYLSNCSRRQSRSRS